MKNDLFIVLIFVFFSNFIFSQATMDSELRSKLESKTKFQDTKSTILAHLNDKLSKLDIKDSIGRKKVIRQLKMWNRQFWINEYYTDGNDKVMDAHQLDQEAYFEKKREDDKSSDRSQNENWQLQGPLYNVIDNIFGEGMGRVDVIAIHPTTPNIMYAGTPHGGLFWTNDQGENWAPLGDFLPSLGVAGIAIHPTNPSIMYILSGDRQKGSEGGFEGTQTTEGSVSRSLGLFKSIDGGNTWQHLRSSDVFNHATNVIIDPLNPTTLYISGDVGIFKSVDSGATWNQIGFGFFWDIKLKPGSSLRLYAVTQNNFWVSPDGGLSWDSIRDLDPIEGTQLAAATRISMAVTPANPNRVVLFAGTNIENGGNLVGIFVSDDSGSQFENRHSNNNLNLFNCYSTFYDNTSSQVNFNNTIAISPTDQNNILVGGLCTWHSINGGYSWFQETGYFIATANEMAQDYIHPDQHFLIFHPDGKIYMGNDGGVYMSDDGGDDWYFKSNGLSATQFYHFERENDEETGSHEGNIWGGTQDNGVLEQNWPSNEYEIYIGGDGYDVMTDRPTLVADGDQSATVYSVNELIYTDCLVADCNITPDTNDVKKEFFANLAWSPHDREKFYAGYMSYVYLTDDFGSDWSFANARGNWCISSCQSNPNYIYSAGSKDNVAMFSRINVANINAPMINNLTANLINAGWHSSLKISDIDVHTLNDSIVYVSIGGGVSNVKVFKTIDAGATWQNWSYNLPNIPIFSIKVDGANGVYVGTSIGVYYKRQGYNYWEPFSNGLPPVPVTEIELWPVPNPLNTPEHSPPTPEVWISTYGRGIWYAKQQASCVSSLTLSGNAKGNQYNETSSSILSTQKIENAGNKIKYNSDEITLNPGFVAKDGTLFKAISKGCGTVVAPDIGDKIYGGRVVYVLLPGDPGYDPNIPHGLVAAEISKDTIFSPVNSLIENTSENLGTGNANTNFLNGFGSGNFAARYCFDLILDGYSDWYLPSKEELRYLFYNKDIIMVGDGHFWSSSQASPATATYFSITYGNSGIASNLAVKKVVPFRSF